MTSEKEIRKGIQARLAAQLKATDEQLRVMNASFDCCMDDPDLAKHFVNKLDTLMEDYKVAFGHLPISHLPDDVTPHEHQQDRMAFRNLLAAIIDTFVRGVPTQEMKDKLMGLAMSRVESTKEGFRKEAQAAETQLTSIVGHMEEISGGEDVQPSKSH